MSHPVPDFKGRDAEDDKLLAHLGYKQELRREFTKLELFGFGFAINAVVPSVA